MREVDAIVIEHSTRVLGVSDMGDEVVSFVVFIDHRLKGVCSSLDVELSIDHEVLMKNWHHFSLEEFCAISALYRERRTQYTRWHDLDGQDDGERLHDGRETLLPYHNIDSLIHGFLNSEHPPISVSVADFQTDGEYV